MIATLLLISVSLLTASSAILVILGVSIDPIFYPIAAAVLVPVVLLLSVPMTRRLLFAPWSQRRSHDGNANGAS